jgi:histidine ammonia-lyase
VTVVASVLLQGAEALSRSINISLCADGIAALTLEALRGTPAAFREEIHAVRFASRWFGDTRVVGC